MVKREVIHKRLKRLDEYLSILRALQKYGYDEFIANPELYGSTERFLHLSIEAINDLGNHWIADENLGEVNWYSDVPRVLAENQLIDEPLTNVWIQMIGFRNVLVHEYTEIDHQIVYDVLQNHLVDLEAIKVVFINLL